MVLLKIWIGALVAVIVFLGLQAVLQERSERLEHAPAAGVPLAMATCE
ncbi:hypothetical protein [Burkholderia contaminans]|nr:hypothetical protein [Burkholderia contaminans]